MATARISQQLYQMAYLFRDSSTGSISAKVTAKGRLLSLKEGRINITRFRLFDPEINYQLLNPDNIDQDDPDIVAQSIDDGSANDWGTEYSKELAKGAHMLLNSPYYVRQQPMIVGNRITDNPLYAQNVEIILDIASLTGDNSFLFASQTSVTGIIVSANAFYGVKVTVADANGSAINGTTVSLYKNNALDQTKSLADNTVLTFGNLSANQSYKVIVSNPTYTFKNSELGQGFWQVSLLNSNKEISFLGTPATFSSGTLIVSGSLSSAISAAAISGIRVNLQYAGTLTSTTSNSSGVYAFSSLSSNIQYAVSIDNANWYHDKNASTTGTLTANRQHNLLLFPTSRFSGYTYYYGTTNPISNAIVSLYQGTTAATSSRYVLSVATDGNGFFDLPNIELQNAHYIQAALKGYTFTNSPKEYASTSVTGSISGILIYGRKEERPVFYDIPFPFRRRTIVDDPNDAPCFTDPCSWLFYSYKYGTCSWSTTYNYSPIRHEQVVKSSDYVSLVDNLAGPYTIVWNSRQKQTNAFNADSFSAYISDRYVVKIALYALPYKFSFLDSAPQWDQFSKTDKQIVFPQQVNSLVKDLQLEIGKKAVYVDIVPQFENQQVALSVNDVNKLTSLLPRTQVNVSVDVNSQNAIPNLGLLASNSFNIDQNVMQVTLAPFELAQNGDYVNFVSVQGPEKNVPVQVTIDDFEIVQASTFQDQSDKQVFSVANAPLCFFVPADPLFLNQLFVTGLGSPFGFTEFIDIIRTTGFSFDRVTQWIAEGPEYSIAKSAAALTIQAFGATRSFDQLMFVQNATHYTAYSELSQFVTSYLGVKSTDIDSIAAVSSNASLVDWLFYVYMVSCGAFKNAFNTGAFQQLMSVSKQAKAAVLFDIMKKGKTLADAAGEMVARQYQPSDQALAILSQISADQSFANTAITAPQLAQTAVTSPVGSPVGGALFSPVGAPTGAVAAAPIGGAVLASPVASVNLPNAGQTAFVKTSDSLKADYAFLSKQIAQPFLTNTVNLVVNEVYSVPGFDYKQKYSVVIKTFTSKPIVSAVTKPVSRVDVVMKKVRPIVQRIIKISGANNYFNANPSLEKKFKLSVKFDMSNPETKDNFLKMVNYLVDGLYTFYLGVEIMDEGTITKNLNASVLTLDDYTTAPQEVKDAFAESECAKGDKIQFLIPLTLGGLKQQTTRVGLGDPVTFNGNAIVRRIPYVKETSGPSVQHIDHLLRIVKLSDVTSTALSVINPSVITANDYIAFDLIELQGAVDTRKLRRFLQILDRYNYDTLNQDVNDLRATLNASYKDVLGAVYVGSFGPGFAGSTKGPNFWTSSRILWPQGATPLAILEKIITSRGTAEFAGNVISVGQVVTSINDFKLN